MSSADVTITDAHYGKTLELWQCARCGTEFVPRSRLVGLANLYEDMEDEEYVASEPTRCRQFECLLSSALRYASGARRVLDVGAAMGSMVAACRRRGLEADGIEPSRYLVGKAAILNGVSLIAGTLPHPALAGRLYDLVFLTDVIEHVPDPAGLLSAAAAHLSAEGLLVVTTPDVSSVTARVLGRHWWHYRLAHVTYLSPRSMKALATKVDLVVIATRMACWYLPGGYLLKRIARFIGAPVLASRWIVRMLAGYTVPVLLFDSKTFVLARQKTSVVSSGGDIQ